MKKIKLVECPRDAMQGWPHRIPTDQKIRYINALLEVGFDTIDFGSFVSARAIPQMADTLAVLKGLQLKNTRSKLLAIVANVRGAEDACSHEAIHYAGYPFSISETFQLRNTNATIAESVQRVKAIQSICRTTGKELVVYISMGFGNPYGDPYSPQLAYEWIDRLVQSGVTIISLADTVGLASPEQIAAMTHYTIEAFPSTEIGVHLHSTAANWRDKLSAAYQAGCRRFDGALKGIGGCPMANDDLVGNLNTENILSFFEQLGNPVPVNKKALENCLEMAGAIFQ